MDILCQVCGEPWDSFGITYAKGEGDMVPEEVKQFRQGKGCPACGFGKFCTDCNATGLIPVSSRLFPDCPTCGGDRYIIVRRVIRMRDEYDRWHEVIPGNWIQAYGKTAKEHPETLKIIEQYKPEVYKDSIAECAKALCPVCQHNPDLEKCPTCQGTGERKTKDWEAKERGLASLLEASDEEPIGIIEESLSE